MCTCAQAPLRPENLIALAKDSGIEVRRVAALGLAKLAQDDHGNALGPLAQPLVSLAFADDAELCRHAAKALGCVALKEVNKRRVVRAGGVGLFCTLLQRGRDGGDLELQRTAAKGLANLSSTDRKTRATVIKEVENSVPAVHDFTDSVVNLYLEMVFTS